MELQDYLINRGLEKLSQEFKIKINRHGDFDNLVCLKYSQLESPMGEKIVQQCRGTILDEANNWEIISYPYDKFFNYGEGHAPEINWDTAQVYDKLDGSLMTLYHYQGAWRVQSSGTADAAGQVGGFKYTFGQLFWKVWQELDYQLPEDTDYCFMFELMTPYNRIVVKQNSNNLVLHGVRHVRTLKEAHPQVWGSKYNWTVVKSYPLQTIEEIVAATNALDPMDSEGYIVCDRHFQRIKIKSPQYVAIAHLKTGFSTRRMIEIVVTNEGDEFLTYYPEWQELHSQVKEQYDRVVQEIETAYTQYKDIPVQKDFALAIKHQTTIHKLESLLNIDFVELG